MIFLAVFKSELLSTENSGSFGYSLQLLVNDLELFQSVEPILPRQLLGMLLDFQIRVLVVLQGWSPYRRFPL